MYVLLSKPEVLKTYTLAQSQREKCGAFLIPQISLDLPPLMTKKSFCWRRDTVLHHFSLRRKTAHFLGECSVDSPYEEAATISIPRRLILKEVWSKLSSLEEKNHNFRWRLRILKTQNCSWFWYDKGIYLASDIPGSSNALVRVAHSNSPVFKEVSTKLQNRLRFTVSQASHFYFHFISICARYRASCNKSLLREQFPNLLNLYRGSGPRNTCTFNWLHVSNMAVQKLRIIK